jgi:uncharacterized membrane protein YccF (DUF307 family)
MFCTHCGTQGEGRFCTSCGQALGEVSTQASPLTSTFTHDARSPLMDSGPPGHLVPLDSLHDDSLVTTQPTVRSGSVPVAPPVANSTNVSVNVAGPQIIYQGADGPGLLVRALWFFFIGWYVGFFWILLAALLNTTIIGLPLGIMMFNAVPKVMTLKSRATRLNVVANADGTYTMSHRHVQQHEFWIRAVYFLLVGWWFSFVWAMGAYFIGLLIITLPISFLMFDRLPAVTTLARY